MFYREADKYKVPYKILSPFKNEELFIHACFNKKVYRSLFKKKKPIYGYIQKKYSNLKIKSYSKSFNIRSSLEDMKIN